MASILLFEWTTGGGLLYEAADSGRYAGKSSQPLANEGLALVNGLLRDMVDARHSVYVIADHRLKSIHSAGRPVIVAYPQQVSRSLQTLASEVDLILPIAPESSGSLATCLSWLDGSIDKVISPTGEFAKVCSSKQRTCESLSRAGVPVPAGRCVDRRALPLAAWEACLADPGLVCKPDDGAGGDTQPPDASREDGGAHHRLWRVESLINGLPVSVAIWCNGRRRCCMPPTAQMLSRPGYGKYLGASYPISTERCRRAWQLADRTVDALPDTRGWVGIDMILAEKSDDDCVLEVNPRMTTSYLLLRQAYRDNLADAMLRWLAGETPEMAFCEDPLEFRLPA